MLHAINNNLNNRKCGRKKFIRRERNCNQCFLLCFPVPIIGFFVCNIYDLLRDQSRTELEWLGQNQERLCVQIYVDKKRCFYARQDVALFRGSSQSFEENLWKALLSDISEVSLLGFNKSLTEFKSKLCYQQSLWSAVLKVRRLIISSFINRPLIISNLLDRTTSKGQVKVQ